MRITFVIASLRGGGSERATVNLANYWAARGWTPTIVTMYHRGKPPAYPLHPGVVHRDLDWELPPAERPAPPPEMLRQVDAALALFSPASRHYLLQHRDVLAVLRQAIVESRPEAVVSMINSTNIRTIAATRGLGVRVFVSERGRRRAHARRPRLLRPQGRAPRLRHSERRPPARRAAARRPQRRARAGVARPAVVGEGLRSADQVVRARGGRASVLEARDLGTRRRSGKARKLRRAARRRRPRDARRLHRRHGRRPRARRPVRAAVAS